MPSLRKLRRRQRPGPELSVVVVAYEMERELPRTLTSLAPEHQHHIGAGDYEVIVVDNGSPTPATLDGAGSNARLVRIDDASPSPAGAINRGLAEARGEIVAVMIDGARLASPGLLHFGRRAAQLDATAVVATLGYYLGADSQRMAVRAGADHATEDALLDAVDWPADGYRLFEVSTMDDSTADGWFAPISECNCLFLTRAGWDALGGADERFDAPGGGLVNLDLYRRAVELPGAQLVVLLGEATFHQLHGGAATAEAPEEFETAWDAWAAQYETIRGVPYAKPEPASAPWYLGTLPEPVLARLTHAAIRPGLGAAAPLGAGFDTVRWTAAPREPRADPLDEALELLVHRELAAGHPTGAVAVARLARERAPDAPEPQRVLALLSGWIPFGQPAPEHRVEHHLAMGEAFAILGDRAGAEEHFGAALTFERNLEQAHIGLSQLRMPGDFYLDWLERLYAWLDPRVVLEIGVAQGLSLARVPATAHAIGVDPVPRATVPLPGRTTIFPETSDAFFAAGRLTELLAGAPLDVAFIDGLHLFEQALRDFVNVERHCGPGSLVLFHDTVPLDETTQRRSCDTDFHTGDVWKVVPLLRRHRPDLDVFTIATPWTGLTAVAGFGDAGAAAGLAAEFDARVDEWVDEPWTEARRADLELVENDWDVVRTRLAPLARASDSRVG